jgi:opacity protein-like surface antigen
MKTLTIIGLLALLAFTGNAQGVFDAGLKAGINTSKISTSKDNYTPETINNYLFGAFMRINMGRIYIQPEAYFNSKGGEYIDEFNASTINSFNLKTVDVPALLGFKIIDQKAFNLRVMAGPVFSFVTDKSTKGQFAEDKLKDNFFGWQYGAGVDFLFLTLDVRKETYSDDIYTSPDFNTKNGNFVVSLGIKLF